MNNNIYRGYSSVVLSSLAYGVMPVISKYLLISGMDSDNVVFYRFFFTCIFTGLLVTVGKGWKKISLIQLTELVLFGILGFGLTMQFLTCSYQYIPIGLATVLHFAYPLSVTVIMLVFYRERPTWARISGCAAALAGICLMVDFTGSFTMKGIIYALLSAITYSSFVVSNKKASFSRLNPLLNLFGFSLSASLFFGLRCAFQGTLILPARPVQWGLMLAISLLCTIFAFYMLMAGVRILGAVKASIVNMIEPATGVVLGIIIFQETLTLKIMIGCLCILISTLIMILDRDAKRDGGKNQ